LKSRSLSHFLLKLAEAYEILHRLSGLGSSNGVTIVSRPPPELLIKRQKLLRLSPMQPIVRIRNAI